MRRPEPLVSDVSGKLLQSISPSCRICGRAKSDPLFDLSGYSLWRCPNCDFVYVGNRPDPGELAGIYERLPLRHEKFRSALAAQWENSRRLRLVRRYLGKDASVLDAGCATGDFVAQAKSFFRMSATDVATSAVEIAKARNPECADRIWAGPLEKLTVNTQFDAVCLWDVIEHIWDPLPVCQELMDRLRPGGFLFISTPDAGSLIARLLGSRWAFMIPPEHLSLFARRTFRILFNGAMPAEIIYQRSLGKWTNLAFILYKLERMLGLRIQTALDWIARSRLGRIMLYIPTADIQYLVVRKRDRTKHSH